MKNFGIKKCLHLPALVFLLIGFTKAYCQDGARSISMGHASTAATGYWSLFSNPSGIAKSESKFAVGAGYESAYLFPDVGTNIVGARLSLNRSHFGLAYRGFGYSLYRESQFKGVYALELAPKFRAAIGAEYFLLQLPENYGSRGIISGELGFQVDVAKTTTLAAYVANLNRPKVSDFQDERLAPVLRIGVQSWLARSVLISGEVEKDWRYKPNVKAGIEYKALEQVYFRMGVQTFPLQYAAGVGLELGNFVVDVASSFHQNLGFSPQLNLGYHFGRKKSNEEADEDESN